MNAPSGMYLLAGVTIGVDYPGSPAFLLNTSWALTFSGAPSGYVSRAPSP